MRQGAYRLRRRQDRYRLCGWAIVLAFVMLAGQSATAFAAPEIVWQVANPFRLFANAEHTNLHRGALAELDENEKLQPVFSVEQRLARQFRDGWARQIYQQTCWNRRDNRYVACHGSPAYTRPEHHVIEAHLEAADGLRELAGERCLWRVVGITDGAPDLALLVVETSCGTGVSLQMPYPVGAIVQVEAGGELLAQSHVKVRDMFIVGMGDSFGAGEGNPDKPVQFLDDRTINYGTSSGGVDLSGYPARGGDWEVVGDDKFLENGAQWLSQACHRSLYSYQARVALQLAIEAPHRAVTFANFACAGAEITFGLFHNDAGNEWVARPPELSQLSAAAVAQCGGHEAIDKKYPVAFSLNRTIESLFDVPLKRCPRVKSRAIDILMLSVGGNDIGFSRLVANAVLADRSTLRRLSGWMGKVHGAGEAMRQLGELKRRYKVLNRALHSILHIPWREPDRIILIDYPTISLMADGEAVCPDGQAGMSVYPEFRLSEVKAKEGERVARALQTTMAAAARAHGWSYVSEHRKAFAGRSVCAGAAGVEISRADDVRMPRLVDGRWYPFPPTAYRAYAARRRLFRTPNDAYMTGNFHVGATIAKAVLNLEQLSWFQVVLASTYSGAFHPTAEGQAVIADATVRAARKVLAKYGGGRRTLAPRGHAER